MKPGTSYGKFATLIALVIPACAQPASVAGQVTEILHGRPVPGASVELLHLSDAWSTFTDSEGRYRIDNLPAGAYTAVFGSRGYIDNRSQVKLAAGETHALDPKLTPAGVISGRVLDADGDPIRDVSVYALSSATEPPSARATASSDDRGEYRLYNLPAGTYYVRATAPSHPGGEIFPGQQIRGSRPPQGYRMTYYPGGTDQHAASAVEVRPGEEVSHINLRMMAEVLYTIRVKTPPPIPGQPLPSFALQTRTGFPVLTAYGSELSGVLPGSYELIGTRSRPVFAYFRLPVEVVDHDVEIQMPEFTPAFDVKGSVQVDGAPPFPLDRVRVRLTLDPPAMLQAPTVTVAADGAVTAHDVLPEAYLVLAGVPAGAYLKAIKLGDREVPDPRVDFSAGATPFTLLLATDGGRIRGSADHAGVVLTLYPEGGAGNPTRTASVNPDGRFQMSDIPPGDYRLYAWDESERDNSRDAAFRRKYQSQSVAVTVEPHGDTVVSLKAIVK